MTTPLVKIRDTVACGSVLASSAQTPTSVVIRAVVAEPPLIFYKKNLLFLYKCQYFSFGDLCSHNPSPVRPQVIT